VSEHELLAAARRGDHVAFGLLLDLYDRPLRALAYRLVGDRDDMDDVMQEAAVKAYIGLGSFDGRAAFGTWLHRITFTTCIDFLRARERTQTSPLTDDVPGDAGSVPAAASIRTSDPAAAAVSRLDLAAAMAALPLEQRAVVCLVLELGYSIGEAAAIVGVPAGTAASRLWYARAVLRQALAPTVEEG